MREWLARPAHAMLDGIESGALDSAELYDAQLGFAREVDGELNAFLAFPAAGAPPAPGLALDAEVGPRKYARLPYACKDIFTTRVAPSTAGSRMLSGYVPPYDA
ncbi:MAG TPA: hypothetical protein VFZ93_06475, partial [Albitalea sp.]